MATTPKKKKLFTTENVIYQMLPYMNTEENIDCAIQKRKADLMMRIKKTTDIKYEFYIDYFGYYCLLPVGRCTPLYLKRLLEAADVQFRNTRAAYCAIARHPKNGTEDYWHALKRFVVDDESMITDIKRAIVEAKRASTRDYIEGRLKPDCGTRTQYVIVTTHRIFPFNPWTEGEEDRLIKVFSDYANSPVSYK